MTMVLQLIRSVALALLTYTDAVQVWHIYTLGFSELLWMSLTGPRAALVPRLVPPGLMMNAVTINSMIIQTSFLVGPALAGVCIDHTGLAMTYSISTLAWCPLSPVSFRTNLWQGRR